MKNCFLFAGQGAQYSGMGKDLWEASGPVRDLFKRASRLVSLDLEGLLFEGAEEELAATDKTQVAVTLMNLSASLSLKEKGVQPVGCAGMSLGEYSALWEAGVIDIDDLFPLVRARGEIMEQASRRLDTPTDKPGMAAVLGLTYEEVIETLETMKDEPLYLANYNSPIQMVLSGTGAALRTAEKAFEDAMRFVPLKVSGPFHSPLLEEARKLFEAVLADVSFHAPRKAVYANVTGRRISSGEEARKLCGLQMVSTVRWVDVEKNIQADGYDRLIEVGPGSVLKGLWKSFDKTQRCLSAGSLDDISALVE